MVMALAVDDLIVGNKYINIKNNNIYQINAFIRSKHPDDGSWYDAILYTDIESGYSYSRSIESFMEKFNEYDDTEIVQL